MVDLVLQMLGGGVPETEAEPNNDHRRGTRPSSTSTMGASSSPSPGSRCESGDARGALPIERGLLRSVALASLVPFFFFSFGHYISFSLFLVNYTEVFWVAGGAQADALIRTVTATAAVSFILLCLSTAATVSASAAPNSGRRLSLRESFSKTSGPWKEPSVSRLYFTILFLGYVLSLVAVIAFTLFVAGDSLWLTSWFVALLALFSSLYLGVLWYVGSSTFVAEEHGRGLEALWVAGALMAEMKLQGFIIFFLSVLLTHWLFLIGLPVWRGGLYEVGMEAIRLPPEAVLMSTLWMWGTCRLFGYVGVQLQVRSAECHLMLPICQVCPPRSDN